jgi:hypothetical protein
VARRARRERWAGHAGMREGSEVRENRGFQMVLLSWGGGCLSAGAITRWGQLREEEEPANRVAGWAN